MSALEIQRRCELMVWPANKQWCARSGDEGDVASIADTPEAAIRAWQREDIIRKMRACNPASPLLKEEIAAFRATGAVPERWRAD